MLVLALLAAGGCHDATSDDGGTPDGGGSGDDSALTAVHTVTWAVLSFAEGGICVADVYGRTIQVEGPAAAWEGWEDTVACSQIGRRPRRGRLLATPGPVAPPAFALQLGYERYRVGETAIDGEVVWRPGVPARMHVHHGVLARPNEDATVAMTLTLADDAPAAAGRWRIAGEGVVQTGRGTLRFEIGEALVWDAACPYPQAGTMTVTRTPAGRPATVRFEAVGPVCDALVEVETGGAVRLLALPGSDEPR